MPRVAGLQMPAIGPVYGDDEDMTLDNAMVVGQVLPYASNGSLFDISSWPTPARNEVMSLIEERGIPLDPPKAITEITYGRTPPLSQHQRFRQWEASLKAVISEVGSRYGLTQFVNTTESMERSHLLCSRCALPIEEGMPRIGVLDRKTICRECARQGSDEERARIELVQIPKGRKRKGESE